MYIGKNTGKPTSSSARVFPNYGCCSKNKKKFLQLLIIKVFYTKITSNYRDYGAL